MSEMWDSQSDLVEVMETNALSYTVDEFGIGYRGWYDIG